MSDNNYVDVIQEEFTGDLDEFDTSQPPPVVQENEGAEIALARIAYRDKAIDKIKALRDYKCQQAVEWANREIIKIEKQKQWHLDSLKYFMEGINRSNPKVKSLSFPSGKIGLRQTPQRIEIDADFVPSEHTDDPFVVAKTTHVVAKEDMKAHLKNTGELPDYASVVPGKKKFYYQPNEEVSDGEQT